MIVFLNVIFIKVILLMSGIKLIEHDIKGKKFASRKLRNLRTVFRILAVIIILACVFVSGWLAKTLTDSKPEPMQEPTVTATPSVQTPEPVPTPEAIQVGGESLEDLPQEANITSYLISKDSNGKRAYLTFDDGPSKNTERMLDILNNYGVKATFFVTGEAAEKYPELIRKIHENGHSIGNHSYSHKYDNIYENPDTFKAEIIDAQNAISSILGEENVMPLFRFPGGSFGEKKKQFLSVIENMGYKYVDWNALNGDAEGGEFTAEKSIEEIKKYCTDTGNVIILMHDTAAKEATVQTLPQIIEYLVSQGYLFDKIVVGQGV